MQKFLGENHSFKANSNNEVKGEKSRYPGKSQTIAVPRSTGRTKIRNRSAEEKQKEKGFLFSRTNPELMTKRTS